MGLVAVIRIIAARSCVADSSVQLAYSEVSPRTFRPTGGMYTCPPWFTAAEVDLAVPFVVDFSISSSVPLGFARGRPTL